MILDGAGFGGIGFVKSSFIECNKKTSIICSSFFVYRSELSDSIAMSRMRLSAPF